MAHFKIPKSYLRDDTGARRFWPVICCLIDIPALDRDRNQLWAEAKYRFDRGDVWWLETTQLVTAATQQQAERFESDPWEEVLAPWISTRSSASISEALSCCLDKPRAQWTQIDKNRIARCFHALGWERYRERQGIDSRMALSASGSFKFPVFLVLVPSLFPVASCWPQTMFPVFSVMFDRLAISKRP